MSVSIEDEMRPVFKALEETARMIAEMAEVLAANANNLAGLAEGGEQKLVYTIAQAAEVLECSRDFVEDMVNDRRIPFVKLGPKKTVIPVRALQEWLDQEAQDSLNRWNETPPE